MVKARKKTKNQEPKTKVTWAEVKRQKVLLLWAGILTLSAIVFYYLPLAGWTMAFQNYKPKD